MLICVYVDALGRVVCCSWVDAGVDVVDVYVGVLT